MFHLKEEVIVISRWDLSLFLSNCGGGGGVGNLIKFSAVANYVLSGGPAPLHPSTHLSSQAGVLVRKLSQLIPLTPGISSYSVESAVS
jgi:hypothetical protein